MDRYITRESRTTSNYPQGNQTMAFSTNATTTNIMPSENIYCGGPYDVNQFVKGGNLPNSSYGDFGHMNAPIFGQNIHRIQGQLISGIDPRYLSNYSDNSAQFIAPGQMMQNDMGPVSNDPSSGFGNNSNFRPNYQNLTYVTSESNKPTTFTPRVISNDTTRNLIGLDGRKNAPKQMLQQNQFPNNPPVNNQIMQAGLGHVSNDLNSGLPRDSMFGSNYQNRSFVGVEKNRTKSFIPHNTSNASSKEATSNAPKKVSHNQVLSRAERLQALHKSGPRAFSGPVEKVLKWHKALQDIGAFIFYEIVAKCVSIRAGDSCSKNLVIRDENGPAMQVVYYEIDFLLPEIKIPSTVRVIGRIQPGTCRLQAFSVRPATGDDVAMLSRRAAIAAHHVAKLCKEYGMNT